MKTKKLAAVLLSLIIVSCTSTVRFNKSDNKETDYESTIDINLLQVNCWINVMPGSENRFNISGMLLVNESPGYNNKNAVLQNIKIIQDNKEIYFIKPIVRRDESSGELSFSTVKGLFKNENLNLDKSVDIYFIFEEDDDVFTYFKRNCKIERVH